MTKKNGADNNDPSMQRSGSQLGLSNIDMIYAKIAPYLSEPEFIKGFLEQHSQASREQLSELIEKELKNCEMVRRTDLRILLNSL